MSISKSALGKGTRKCGFNHYKVNGLRRMSLKLLPLATVKLLGSTQVVTSVLSAVKELIENSIDAGARSIDVRLENYGLDKIEVKDDGCGIAEDEVPLMCQRSYTSKIADFGDLEKLVSYGFRGEALNSLCSVAKVSVTTKSNKDQVGRTYYFDCNGELIDSKLSHIAKGTVITVEGLFKNVPVRRQFLSKEKKKQEELKKIESIVKSLAIIQPQLRLTLIHNKFLICQKSKVQTIRQGLIQLVSPSLVSQLHDLFYENDEVKFELLIPKKDCSIGLLCHGTTSDAVYLYINSRPVRDKQIERAILDEVILYFGSSIPDRKVPMCVASVHLPPSALDVNLEPNKTKVLVKDLDDLTALLKSKILDYYVGDESIPNSNQRSEIKAVMMTNFDDKSDGEESSFVEVPQCDDEGISFSPVKASTQRTEKLNEGNKRKSELEITEGSIATTNSPNTSPVPKKARRTKAEVEKEQNITNFLDGLMVRVQMSESTSSECSPSPKVSDIVIESVPIVTQDEVSTNIEEITLSQWSKGEVQNMNGVPRPIRMLADVTSVSPVESNSTQNRSVSSQMGCKEMSAFTRFAREMRSNIIAQNPGITFTKVASELASKWKSLQDEERDIYEKKAAEDKKIKKEKSNESKTSPVTEGPSRSNPFKRRALKKSYQSNFCMKELRISLKKWKESHAVPEVELIGKLGENLVLCRDGAGISVFSPHRLQETQCYFLNLCEMSIPTKQLHERLVILECDLNDSLWELLCSFETCTQASGRTIIKDQKIIKNGLVIEVIEGQCGVGFQICEIPSHMDLFTLEDLKELLQMIYEKGILCELQDCRSPKSVSYIRYMTIISLEKINTSFQNVNILQKVKYWINKARKYSSDCPHSNPISQSIGEV